MGSTLKNKLLPNIPRYSQKFGKNYFFFYINYLFCTVQLALTPFFIWYTTLCTIFTILLTLWNSEQKNGLLIKLFCFSSDFDETWWSCSYPCVLQFHQVSSKSDEKQKSFINSPFFCSEFQSVSRIVKIVHSAGSTTYIRCNF